MAVSVPVPPFETFYEAHRDEVLGFLRKRVGGQVAEDAFQETFLRALRAYPRLEHGLHLRAWVLTIASRIVLDDARRARPTAELPELPDPSNSLLLGGFEALADLAAPLPPKEKAAVVLRYGYDLDYAQIGAALGSSEAAARQAASSGVRRLRKELRP
jgi:RNA polymerase sigma factor (sigma-70 family)